MMKENPLNCSNKGMASTSAYIRTLKLPLRARCKASDAAAGFAKTAKAVLSFIHLRRAVNFGHLDFLLLRLSMEHANNRLQQGNCTPRLACSPT